MDSRLSCICSLITPSALLCLCVLVSFFHRLLTLICILTVSPSSSSSCVLGFSSHCCYYFHRSLGILSANFLHHIPQPLCLSPSLSLSAISFFLVCVCLFPRLCGQSPCSGLSVSWLTEGSQSLQYKHETISKWLAGWLWTVETSLHISMSQARSTALPINHISW